MAQPMPDEMQSLPPRRRGGLAGWIVLILVLAVLVIAAIYWRSRPPAGVATAAAGQPVPVAVTAAQVGAFVVRSEQPGTVVPAARVVVRSQVAGELTRVLFNGGQRVRKGELLAEVNPQAFQTQLTLAQADLARSQAQAANAADTLKHLQALLDENSIARQRVVDQQALAEQSAAEVKAAQSRVDTAQLQLKQTRITAPIAGLVGLREVDAGNLVAPGDPRGIATITQAQPSRVTFALPATVAPQAIAELHRDACVPVTALGDAPGEVLGQGRLLAAGNEVNAATGTVPFEAEFANKDGLLLPGLFVTVALPLRTLADAVQVPSAAVQQGADGAFVYTVQDGKAAVAPVKLGPSDATTTVIASGLTGGAQVVVRGADRLRAGAAVQATEEPAPAAAATSAGDGASACPTPAKRP